MSAKEDESTLGPLPPLWEKACTPNGEVYFIDHNTGTSHWLDPRLSRFRKKSLAECREDELPFGWERIECPRYGAYFIDHVNRRTQYENPVLQARTTLRSMLSRDPDRLAGHRFTVTLFKSSQGLGFTLVGGADETPDEARSSDEYLQIKSIVPNSPAWLDGALRTGDLLVRVGSACVLGAGHARVARIFQDIPPGSSVTLELCRGYPLPYDPDDPNTRVLTTVAVEGGDAARMRHLTDELRERFSLDDADRPEETGESPEPRGGADGWPRRQLAPSDIAEEGGVLTLRLTKGAAGFGFTIADSVHGQKVKKVLDRVRCGGLREGDLLVSINRNTVTDVSHAHVVQVLKDCPQKREATIKVVRPHTSVNGHSKQSGAAKSKLAKDITNLFRSKTPTADLYSTQQKEVLPSRPKTPLVDTRNMTTADNYINLDYDREDPSAADAHRTSPNSTASYKFTKKRRNASGMTDAHSTNSIGSGDVTDKNGNPDVPVSNKYRGTGVGATTDAEGADGSTYDNDAGTLPLVRTLALNESNIAAAYGSSSATNNADSIAGESSDNGGFSEEGPAASAVSVGIAGSGRGSAAGRFGCYDSGSADSPLISGSRPHQNKLLMSHHNYDIIPPGVNNWSASRMNQMDESMDADTDADMMVTLPRGATGFGFRIVGGTEEGSQVAVGHIVPGGSCDLDGRIFPGDLLTSVDGVSTLGVSHRVAVAGVCRAAVNGQVTLGIKKNRNNNFSSHCNPMVQNHLPAHSFVGTLQQNRPDVVDDRATADDHSTGNRRQFTHSDSNNSGSLYYNYVDNNYVLNGNGNGNLSYPNDRLSNPNNYDQTDGNSSYSTYYNQNVPKYYPAGNFPKGPSQVTYPYEFRDQTPADMGQYNVSMMSTPYDVVVQRNENEGFGFVIISSTNKSTSTIGQLIAGSPAARCGFLHVGDTILAINHTPIHDLPHNDIVNLIKHSGYSVTLTIQRSSH